MDPCTRHCSPNSPCCGDERSFWRSNLRSSSLHVFFMEFSCHCHGMRTNRFGNLPQSSLAISGSRSHGNYTHRTSRPDSSSTRPHDSGADSGTHFRYGWQPYAEEISQLVIRSQAGDGLTGSALSLQLCSSVLKNFLIALNRRCGQFRELILIPGLKSQRNGLNLEIPCRLIVLC